MEIDVPGLFSRTSSRGGLSGDSFGKSRPVGLRILVPGYAQRCWGQRERASVFLVSYLAALITALFLWGTLTGLMLLAFAYLIHAVSTTDALAQEAFPPRGAGVRGLTVSCGLGLGVYLPVLTWLTLVAWPGMRGDSDSDRYLVNCRAYQNADPQRDDWVCYRSSPEGETAVGRVVAIDGQEVDWEIDTLRVNGLRVENLSAPFRGLRPPRRLSYRLPRGLILIDPRDRPADWTTDDGLVTVSRDQIVGRAWAKLYPIRERQLLLTGSRSPRTHNS